MRPTIYDNDHKLYELVLEDEQDEVFAVSFVADQFTIYKATKELFDSIIYLVIAGLGFTASEKFAKKEIEK